MLRRGQVDHVKAERNVLAEIHNPFIVRLFYSFQVSEQQADTFGNVSFSPEVPCLHTMYAAGEELVCAG